MKVLLGGVGVSILLVTAPLAQDCRPLAGDALLQPTYDRDLRATITGKVTMWQQPYAYLSPDPDSRLVFDSIANGGGDFTVDTLLAGKSLSYPLSQLLDPRATTSAGAGHIFTLRPDDYAGFLVSSIAEFDRLARLEQTARDFYDAQSKERADFDSARKDVETYLTKRRFQSLFLESYTVPMTMNRVNNEKYVTSNTAPLLDGWVNGTVQYSGPEVNGLATMDFYYDQQIKTDETARQMAFRDYQGSLGRRITDVLDQRSLLKSNFNKTLSTVLRSYGLCADSCFVGDTAFAPGEERWVRQGEFLASVATDVRKWDLDASVTAADIAAMVQRAGRVDEGVFLKLDVPAASQDDGANALSLFQRLPLNVAKAQWYARRGADGVLPLEMSLPDDQFERLAAAVSSEPRGEVPVHFEVLSGHLLDKPKFADDGTWDTTDPENFDLKTMCSVQ